MDPDRTAQRHRHGQWSDVIRPVAIGISGDLLRLRCGGPGRSFQAHEPCRSGSHRDVAHKPPHDNVLTPYCPARILQVECPNKRVNELVGIRGPDGSPRSNRAPTRGRMESVVLPAKSPSLSSHIEPSHADDESFRSSSPTLLGGATGMSPVRPVGRLDLKGLVLLRIETLRQRLPRRQAAMKLPVSVLRRSCQTNVVAALHNHRASVGDRIPCPSQFFSLGLAHGVDCHDSCTQYWAP
ncbi:hypothetical protein VTI28DRAFT_8698 [Corynascus sepedonium]